jgi:hypothetical protein
LIAGGEQVLGTLSFNGGTSGASTISLAATPGVISDATAGSLLSLRLYAPQGETAVSGLFNARSATNAANRPALTLEANVVPEASGMALLATASLLFGGVAPRRLNSSGYDLA